MLCDKCGAKIEEDSNFCEKCGTKIVKNVNSCKKCGGKIESSSTIQSQSDSPTIEQQKTASTIENFKLAAEQGDAESQRVLGMLYLDGNGIAKDEKLALKWLTKAAEQGDVEIQCILYIWFQSQGTWYFRNIFIKSYRCI